MIQLSDDDLWRSRSAVPGRLGRLRRVAERARAGEAIRVVVLGGSVTNGGACQSYLLKQSVHVSSGSVGGWVGA